MLNLLQMYIQAPMAGITTPKFVAACCEAGFLGQIGAGYLDGDKTKSFIQQVKQLTDKPFGVNLFVQDEPKIDVQVLDQARMALQPFYEELEISPIQTVVSDDVFTGQIQAIIDEKVPVCSFTFGLPSEDVLARLLNAGVYCIGTATTVEEAVAVQSAGLHAVVLQGTEAGGHRGSFTEPLAFISTEQLVLEAKKYITIPIIAAGGIMNKMHKDIMLKAGASAIQVGTVLLVADECEASELHKVAILQSAEQATTLTKAFTGKYARGLKNIFTEHMEHEVTAPYPLQHYLTLPIRKKSKQLKKPEYLSLWMGTNSHLAKRATVQQIFRSFQ